jgi:hypothetical protein
VSGNGRGTITRADIEAKLKAIQDSMAPVADGAKSGAMAIVPVVVVVLVLAAYVVGRRKGNKRRAVIEIRRV